MKSPVTITGDGNPYYPFPEARKQAILAQYIFDEYNEYGFGYGEIIDTHTWQPVRSHPHIT